jgi:hypothetical protein
MRNLALNKMEAFNLVKRRITEKQDDRLALYIDILSGKVAKFPKFTWTLSPDGYARFKTCFQYVVKEKMKWEREDLLFKVTDQFFQTWKLYGGMEVLFSYCIYDAINSSFPEYKILPWEMKIKSHFVWSEDNIKLSIRWLFLDKLSWNRLDTITQVTQLTIIENGLSSAFTALRSLGIFNRVGIYELLHFSFPEYNLKKWEFRKMRTWCPADVKEAVRSFVEEELQLGSFEAMKEQLYYKTFDDHDKRHLLCFNNDFKSTMSFAYPEYDWSFLLERKIFVSEETRLKATGNPRLNDDQVDHILDSYRLGKLTVYELADMYQMSPHSIYRIVNGTGWIKNTQLKIDNYVRISKAATQWGIPSHKLKRLCSENKIPAIKRGGHWYVDIQTTSLPS